MKGQPPCMLSCFLYMVYMSTVGLFFLIATSNKIPTRVLPIEQHELYNTDPIQQYFSRSVQSKDLDDIDPIEQYFEISVKSNGLDTIDPIEQYFENSVKSNGLDTPDPIEQYFLKSVKSSTDDLDKKYLVNQVQSNITIDKVTMQHQNKSNDKKIPSPYQASKTFNNMQPKEQTYKRGMELNSNRDLSVNTIVGQGRINKLGNRNILDGQLNINTSFLNYHKPEKLFQEKMDMNDIEKSVTKSGLQLRFNSSVVTIPEPDCSRKQLIYTCSQEESCGGLGDRQRGIVSLFLLAIYTNRTFGISFTKSCPLTNFFLPNVYDWTKCLPLKRNTNSLEKKYEKFLKGPENFAEFKTGIWEQDLVVLNNHAYLGNKIKSHPDAKFIVPWIFPQMLRHLTYSVFHFFFKLRDEIKTQIDSYINKITENHSKVLVGVHVRKEFINEGDEKQIIEFIKSYDNPSKYSIYLATDTDELRQYASNLFPNLFTLNVTGTVLHTDEKSASCKTLLIAIFEQQILAHSDILIKSPSVFSHMAFAIRGPKGITFDFKPANDRFPARFERKDFT